VASGKQPAHGIEQARLFLLFSAYGLFYRVLKTAI